MISWDKYIRMTETVCVTVGLWTYMDVFRSTFIVCVYMYFTYLYNVMYLLLLLQRDVRYWYRFATSRHRPVSPAKWIWNYAAIKHICWYWQMQKYNAGECCLTFVSSIKLFIPWKQTNSCWKRFKCGFKMCFFFT